MAKYRGRYMDKKRSRKKGWWMIAALMLALMWGAYALSREQPEESRELELLSEVTIEAGNTIPLAQAFAPQGMELEITYGSDISHIDSRIPGRYPVVLLAEGAAQYADIVILDTVSPQGKTRDLIVDQRDMPSANDFIVEIQDETDVTVRFKNEPDSNCAETQILTLILTDTSGNTTELNVSLTVIIDQEAPLIEGVQDIEVYQGEAVAYRTGITVTDNQDEMPVLEIDSSNVNLAVPGVYEVIYVATDTTGNKTEKTCVVTVLEKKESYVELDLIYEKADQILSRIITEGMTDEEQVEAVYYYIRKNYGYIGTSDKNDWRQAAYKMMEIRCGDCFSYFALFKLLMERLEIPNIDVVKVKNYEGDSSHFWSLVSVDGGETYYHVDTTHRNNDPTQFLLVTDTFLDDYSAKHYNCFNRDKSLYPATPEE